MSRDPQCGPDRREVAGSKPPAPTRSFDRHNVRQEFRKITKAAGLENDWGPVRDTEIGGHAIPAWSSVIIAPWVLHRDTRLFADSLNFRPHRWTEEFERSLPKLAYCPFGGGARMCLGEGFSMMEAVLALAVLNRDCRVRSASDEPAELWTTFTLRSRHGIPLTVLASDGAP